MIDVPDYATEGYALTTLLGGLIARLPRTEVGDEITCYYHPGQIPNKRLDDGLMPLQIPDDEPAPMS